mmetsp:Transcript_20938/g.37087  ORF Transcript_20938/g.37087 Transcript_20938/m.37087 type:complete len:93 (-) Transcript_20938:58-336(-)|eukprot:CAMPEP_0184524704 /NCGR_PEP_ID=MMETSP0198_2-20121128/9675_1 /TAXON_ID=1112570 /ORGANISM="Thraustochytrium sp., Strain LLF1b" /LENGTH=92 /DNA_ID=CAMNT_0026916051 /DNA_START=702 /DNA_END=980 /DNA_ORIENTATION=+
MAPEPPSTPGKTKEEEDVINDLQRQIELITSAAKARNPDGFRLAPLSPSPSVRSTSSEEGSVKVNVLSGQMVQILDCARNTDWCPHLQDAML